MTYQVNDPARVARLIGMGPDEWEEEDIENCWEGLLENLMQKHPRPETKYEGENGLEGDEMVITYMTGCKKAVDEMIQSAGKLIKYRAIGTIEQYKQDLYEIVQDEIDYTIGGYNAPKEQYQLTNY